MDDGADHRYHMDILVGGHPAVRDLHGQQGDVRQGFLRRDVAAGVVQKGESGTEICVRKVLQLGTDDRPAEANTVHVKPRHSAVKRSVCLECIDSTFIERFQVYTQ